MRFTSLSLYAAIWLTSTAVALIARPSNLQPRADTTPKFPEGYNVQTCRFDSPNVILKASPAMSEAVPLPPSAPAAPKSAMARRAFPQADLAQICRQISHRSFTGPDYAHPYNGNTLDIETSLMQPGLYVITVAGDKTLRGLSIAE